MTLILFLAAPTIALVFALGEYLGWWDYLSGRKKALEGFDRLRFAHGWPESFIFAEEDHKVFNALVKRIARNTRRTDLKQRFAQGEIPSVISVLGQPQPIGGLPTDWKQAERFFYPGEQPIIIGFNWYTTPHGLPGEYPNGTGCLGCTLADLREWLNTEKEERKFWIGTVIVSCISIGSILLRVKLHG